MWPLAPLHTCINAEREKFLAWEIGREVFHSGNVIAPRHEIQFRTRTRPCFCCPGVHCGCAADVSLFLWYVCAVATFRSSRLASLPDFRWPSVSCWNHRSRRSRSPPLALLLHRLCCRLRSISVVVVKKSNFVRQQDGGVVVLVAIVARSQIRVDDAFVGWIFTVFGCRPTWLLPDEYSSLFAGRRMQAVFMQPSAPVSVVTDTTLTSTGGAELAPSAVAPGIGLGYSLDTARPRH